MTSRALLALAVLLVTGLWMLRRPSERVLPIEKVSVMHPTPDRVSEDNLVVPLPNAESVETPRNEQQTVAVLALNPTEAQVAASSSPTASIVGRLFDADGDPIRRGQVAVIDGLGGGRRAKVKGNTFRVTELALGTYSVLGAADGFHTSRVRVEVIGPDEISLDLVLERRIAPLVVLLLTTEGLPHPALSAAPEETTYGPTGSLEVLATKEPPPEWVPDVHAIESVGIFQSSRDKELGTLGYLELEDVPPLSASLVFKETVLATQPVYEGDTEVTFRIPVDGIEAKLATIHVRISNAVTGSPVEYASCVLSRESWSSVAYPRDEGIAAFSGLARGPYALQVFGEGLGSDLESVFAEAGEVVEVSCELGAAGRIAGRLVNSSGEPVQGAGPDTVVLIGDLSVRKRILAWDTPPHYRIDEEGRFSIARNRGIYVLRTLGPEGMSANVVVDTTKGSVDDLEIVVREPISISVRLANGSRSWKGCLCLIRDENGVEAAAAPLESPREELWVVPGTYRLVVTDSHGGPLFESSFIVDKEPVELEVRL